MAAFWLLVFLIQTNSRDDQASFGYSERCLGCDDCCSENVCARPCIYWHVWFELAAIGDIISAFRFSWWQNDSIDMEVCLKSIKSSPSTKVGVSCTVDQTLLDSLVELAMKTVSVCIRCALRQHGARFRLLPFKVPQLAPYWHIWSRYLLPFWVI